MINKLYQRWLDFKKKNTIKSQSLIDFEELMKKAYLLHKDEKINGLLDLQRIVLRPVQSLHIRSAYISAENHSINAFDHLLRDFGVSFIPGINKSFLDYVFEKQKAPCNINMELELGKDMILTTPWHPSSIMNICRIGIDRQCGEWEYDSSSHVVDWWIPLNIGCITTAGNHSIAQGIILAEGKITPSHVYDISELFRHLYYNGEYFMCSHTHKILGKPRYDELGWIFEIGRFISQLQVKSEANSASINS